MANTNFREIFSEGYEFTRENGEVVTLTGQEISKISKLIDACLGAGSVEYYMDDIQYDIDDAEDEVKKAAVEQRMKICENFLEDEDKCYEIWNDYWEQISYDSGYLEKNCVEYEVDEALGKN